MATGEDSQVAHADALFCCDWNICFFVFGFRLFLEILYIFWSYSNTKCQHFAKRVFLSPRLTCASCYPSHSAKSIMHALQNIPVSPPFTATTRLHRARRISCSRRQQALEDLDFVWADQGGDDGGGSHPWACGWIPAAEMADHLLHSCPRRSALCRDGCGQSLVVMEAERHYQHHCPKR